MHQLSGLDAGFLNMETPTQQGHVAGVVIVDPSTADGEWGFERVRAVIEERIHLLPPFRRRLVSVPFDLDQPYWIEDPDFDLDFHLRHIAVPQPGTHEELSALVARIHERPLDRARPLWETYVIEGLEDGLVAVMTKLHHAAIDGVSGAEILTILLDLDPEGRPVPPPKRPWKPDRMPSQLSLLARSGVTAMLQPARALRLSAQVARSIPAIKPLTTIPAALGLRRDEEMLSRPTLVAPRSILNGALTPHRRWAFGPIPLAAVKGVKDRFEVTVNDVVITICAGAMRRWLLDHDALPDRSLQAMVPISIRTKEDRGVIGNRVSAMIAPIGTHLEDTVERLRFVHETMAIAKEQHRATPATLLQDFAQFAPPAIAARAARLVFRNGRAGRLSPFNLVISNVPGPQFPLYLAGAQLVGHYPVSAIAEGAGLNITLHSYHGKLCFGIVADREMAPDIWNIMEYIETELAELEKAG